MLYGTIAPYCTTESCPVMSAGRKYEYLWADGQQVKRPIKVRLLTQRAQHAQRLTATRLRRCPPRSTWTCCSPGSTTS